MCKSSPESLPRCVVPQTVRAWHELSTQGHWQCAPRGCAGTPNGWKASVALEELGVPYSVRQVSAFLPLQSSTLCLSAQERTPQTSAEPPPEGRRQVVGHRRCRCPRYRASLPLPARRGVQASYALSPCLACKVSQHKLAAHLPLLATGSRRCCVHAWWGAHAVCVPGGVLTLMPTATLPQQFADACRGQRGATESIQCMLPTKCAAGPALPTTLLAAGPGQGAAEGGLVPADQPQRPHSSHRFGAVGRVPLGIFFVQISNLCKTQMQRVGSWTGRWLYLNL